MGLVQRVNNNETLMKDLEENGLHESYADFVTNQLFDVGFSIQIGESVPVRVDVDKVYEFYFLAEEYMDEDEETAGADDAREFLYLSMHVIDEKE